MTYFGPDGLKGEGITIGEHCEIHPSVRIDCDEFSCGDYVTIHRDTWIFGKRVHIGHCSWIGQGCILDGSGGLDIGFAVGIGAGSQVWTHAAQGDRLQGCVLGAGGPWPLVIEDDAWLLPRVVVAGARRIMERAVVLAGSVVTKDVQPLAVVAGAPAARVPMLRAWEPRTPDEIWTAFHELVRQYMDEKGRYPPADIDWQGYDPVARTYIKTGSPEEVAFNRWMFRGKAYFRPKEE